MADILPLAEDLPLFEGYEPPPPVEPEPPMSADRRRTKRQADNIAAGVHPLTRGPLHELASRHRDAASPKSDPFTCGSCWFRESFRRHNNAYPKCTFGLTAEMPYLTSSPRISASATTDVRRRHSIGRSGCSTEYPGGERLMLPSEIHPTMSHNPFARFFARMTEIHPADAAQCPTCRQPTPCDTMRALWIYDLEARPLDGGR